jgi:hypothetical protein
LFPNFVKKDFKQLVYFTNENKIFPKTKRWATGSLINSC